MTKHAAGIVTIIAVLTGSMSGCAVVAVTDAAVSVGATAVNVGANIVGAAADVVRAGVRVLTGNNDQDRK